MEQYKQKLLAKIAELETSNSPFAKTHIVVLLKLLGELQNTE